jgi:class 3 adenylate cyclase/tetratricopeptide (TPR) repeat protein
VEYNLDYSYQDGDYPVTLHTYLPQDRLRAIANDILLPNHTSGSALFADISGFTALTESLRTRLGARPGAEELTKQLGLVYSALITEIEKYGGSVIGFAGDSMLSWFDEVNGSSPRRASTCAFGMQASIKEFPALALKVSIASGDVRRFLVGDEAIQRIDTLAGTTVSRTATGEHLAVRGDVLVDEVTANALSETIQIKEWRSDKESGDRFAVISDQGIKVEEQNVFGAEVQTVTPVLQTLRPYLHKTVYEREISGQGQFLTEFRPCVALFVRFTGIDYDSDSAESKLDNFICSVQATALRHEGTLLDIIIGDKGSYAYINFGALSAHEDDSRRAVKTALELRNKTELQLQVGITQGLMRVGAYGGETRKTYSALGDDVNLAARLMTTANVGEILLSGHVHKAIANQFTFEPRLPLPMKGKAEPLPVFAVTGESQKRAVRLQEPNYSLPMVGRQQELGIINDKLELAKGGKGQVIGIVAEAGLGKSRLVAEVIRSARRKGFIGFGGVCQSDGVYTPYLAWKSIWQAFFDVDHEMPLKRQMRLLEGDIEDRAPSRVDAMPLLNVVLDLNIPENAFTQNLEPKIRQSALHAMLEDCLKSAAPEEPILIVIEDLHWIDALSHDLLEELAKALASHAVCFVLAYRSPQMERLQTPRLEALPHFTRIELHELTKAEAESAIRAKLAQLYPARGGALPTGLVDALMRRAQGNPFYLEELLNYLHDRSIDPADLGRIELPDSLHTLILSRIDKLSEQEKTTLRVASVVGRLFRAKWLTGYYPDLGSYPQVKVALDALDALDITHLDSPEPELSYLFKHIVTHEVTYESLPFATRAKLHEQLAQYLENADVHLDSIAFHYGRSENREKQREYLHKAGEAAQKNFANDAALEHYGRLLLLLNNGKELAEIYLKRGDVLEVMGRYAEAESDYRLALDSVKDDTTLKASVQFALGHLFRLRGDYESALGWLAQAKTTRMTSEDKSGLAQVLIETGYVLYRKGEYTQASELSNEALALAHEIGDTLILAEALNNLGSSAMYQGDYATAQTLYEESLVYKRELGNKPSIANLLNSLGLLTQRQGNHAAARGFYEEGLALSREMGEKSGIATKLLNLGNVSWFLGDPVAAKALLEEALTISQNIGDKNIMFFCLASLGLVRLITSQGTPADVRDARHQLTAALRLAQEMGAQVQITSTLVSMALLAVYEGNPHRSAQLLGAVNAALQMLHVPLDPLIVPFNQQALAAAQKQLGEAVFQSALEEGSQWSLEEAVKKVLNE